MEGQRSSPEEIVEIIVNKDSAIILCTHMQHIIGTIVVQNRIDHAYIGMLTVKPDLQNSGIGKQLLTAAEDYITMQWSLSKIEMAVITQRTELINWYNRHGYLQTGKTKPFPYDNQRFGIPKVSGLEFTILSKNNKCRPRCLL